MFTEDLSYDIKLQDPPILCISVEKVNQTFIYEKLHVKKGKKEPKEHKE